MPALLQITNGALSNSISSPPSLFSITFSVLIAVNGLYRFGYYLFWKGVKFDDIPLPVLRSTSAQQQCEQEGARSAGARLAQH